jgi:POT family proton-dependent oligopeptide transporter
MTLTITIIGLFTIAFGNGLFKGNLQAVVGQMYDNNEYSKHRDNAYMIFYMGINIGAFFAPFAATAMRNWWLKVNGYLHDGSLPAFATGFLRKNSKILQPFSSCRKCKFIGTCHRYLRLCQDYLEFFQKDITRFRNCSRRHGFSLLVYLIFNRLLPEKQNSTAATSEKS